MLYQTNYNEDLDPKMCISFNSTEDYNEAKTVLYHNIIQRLISLGIVTVYRVGTKKVYAQIKDKEKPHMVCHEASKPSDCTCPRCGNVVGETYESGRITVPYCNLCGQRLEWD